MEVPVNNNCRDDMRRLIINGTVYNYSWGSYPGFLFTVKFTDLDT